jgi:hypothetical protein
VLPRALQGSTNLRFLRDMTALLESLPRRQGVVVFPRGPLRMARVSLPTTARVRLTLAERASLSRRPQAAAAGASRAQAP